jgi:hypothetical protein
MLHQLFHVVFLLGFLAAVALAAVAMMAPLLFPERGELRLPPRRAALVLAAAAAGALAADWLLHRVF